MYRSGLLTVLFVVATAGTAGAVTLDFDPLLGPNGTAYTGHSEEGFDVASTGGAWKEAHIFGDPIPDLYSEVMASLEVTHGAGDLFTFESADLAFNNEDFGDYTFEGLLMGGTVFNVAGVALGSDTLGSFDFTTVPSPDTASLIDTLRIKLTGDGTSFNIDNIVLGDETVPKTIPEPVTAAFGLIGLGVLGLKTRRSRA